jgi:hypothetical protein
MASVRTRTQCAAGESDGGDDRSDSGDNGSARETMNRAREPTDRAPSGQAGAEANISAAEADGRIPPQASPPRTRAAGRPGSRADRRSGRTRPGANESGGEDAGSCPKQADGRASRRVLSPSDWARRGWSDSQAHATESRAGPAIRRPQERSRAARSDPGQRAAIGWAEAVNFWPPPTILRMQQTDPPPEQSDPRLSNQIYTRATTSRVRAVESACFHCPRISNDHSALPFNHRAQAPHRARVRAAFIAAARLRILIEHAMFRLRNQNRFRCIDPRPRSPMQALAHVMHLTPRDRVISPCDTRSFEIHHGAVGVAPRDAGPSGMRTHVRRKV